MTTPQAGSMTLDSLCDAFARGRLCLAEMVLLDPGELEAMYQVGVARIDTGRIDEAIVLLQALVALYAYSARYWRTLGLALHLGRRLEAAMLAYQLALHLDPDHIPTIGHLGELKLFCGMPQEAHPLLERAAQSTHAKASARARALLGAPIAPPLPDVPPLAAPPPAEATTASFVLTDGGPLPMPHTGTETQPLAFPHAREVTNRMFLADPPDSQRHITETAIIQHPPHPRALSHEGSATDTGVVDRAGPGTPDAFQGARWDFMRWFASAARRRRSTEPLLADDTQPAGPPRRRP